MCVIVQICTNRFVQLCAIVAQYMCYFLCKHLAELEMSKMYVVSWFRRGKQLFLILSGSLTKVNFMFSHHIYSLNILSKQLLTNFNTFPEIKMQV